MGKLVTPEYWRRHMVVEAIRWTIYLGMPFGLMLSSRKPEFRNYIIDKYMFMRFAAEDEDDDEPRYASYSVYDPSKTGEGSVMGGRVKKQEKTEETEKIE